MIRILLVDDHTLLRDALRVLLEQDKSLQIVAEARDGEAALRRADEFLPDVVVMDVSLPGISGIETTQRLLAKHPGIKVLALSTHLDQGIIQQMLDAGACGYIVKSAAGTELKQGIYRVVEGRSYLCPEVAALVASRLHEQHRSSGKAEPHALSKRERQVATLIAEGKNTPEIAKLLHISPGTADAHRSNLMRKLELHNVVELVKYAIRNGFIVP